MTVIPARVAGVGEVIATVPTPHGQRNAHVLAAMRIAGVDPRVHRRRRASHRRIGVRQRETIPRVDKIVGPGGCLRRRCQTIGIRTGRYRLDCRTERGAHHRRRFRPIRVGTALDLFAQAEHDADAQAILLCPDDDYLDRVQREMEGLLPTMARQAVIRRSLAERGALIAVRDLDEACRLANRPRARALAARRARAGCVAASHPPCWRDFRRSLVGGSAGRLQRRAQPCIADVRYGALRLAVERRGFPKAVVHCSSWAEVGVSIGADRRADRRRRRARGARRVGAGAVGWLRRQRGTSRTSGQNVESRTSGQSVERARGNGPAPAQPSTRQLRH